MARPNDPLHGRGSLSYLLLICLIATLGGLLFGYDTAVISGAIGFLQSFFTLDAKLKGWAASSALIGCVLGVAAAGSLSDRFGRRTVLLLSAVLFLISAIGTAIPQQFSVFVFFRIVGGLGVGAASMTSPLYIAEISPARIRGRMVSINQLAIVLGMVVVYFVNYRIAAAGDELWNVQHGWRWMFGSEAVPAVLLLVLLWFVPESPRWLVEPERRARGAADLDPDRRSPVGGGRIGRDPENDRARVPLARSTAQTGHATRAGDRRRVGRSATGHRDQRVSVFCAGDLQARSSATETDAAMLQTVSVGAVNLLFTLVAIGTVDRVGRKPLMIVGSAGMGLALLGLGLAAYFGHTEAWVLAFILGYIACFAVAVGPVTWVILSEIFPTHIRGRAMAIATVFLWVANFVDLADLPDDGSEPLAGGTVPPRVSLLALCRLLLGLDPLRVVVCPGDEGKIPGRDRGDVAGVGGFQAGSVKKEGVTAIV